MNNISWAEELGASITVCDTEGIILSMNAKAADVFSKEGGKKLIGTNLFDCHPPAARQKLKEIMAARVTNSYTIEKNGIKKLIYQTPWYEHGEFQGLVELSLPIPLEMAHFIRK
jgi:transcriptional regulator with PAS, ATPase and Fis domain